MRIEPIEHQIAEIGNRIAERRKLPIKHSDNAVLRAMKDGVIEPVIPVHDRTFMLRRDCFREPFDERFHLGLMLCFGEFILLGPATDLTRAIIIGLAKIAHAYVTGFFEVEIGHGINQRMIDFPAIIL